MTNWRHRVKVTHLFTKNEDWESVQKSMNDVADVLKNEPCFVFFSIDRFRKIPKGDDFFSPVEYANKLINRMYDFADRYSIWIE